MIGNTLTPEQAPAAEWFGELVGYTPGELNRLVSTTVAERLRQRAAWHIACAAAAAPGRTLTTSQGSRVAALARNRECARLAAWHRGEAGALHALAEAELAGVQR